MPFNAADFLRMQNDIRNRHEREQEERRIQEEAERNVRQMEELAAAEEEQHEWEVADGNFIDADGNFIDIAEIEPAAAPEYPVPRQFRILNPLEDIQQLPPIEVANLVGKRRSTEYTRMALDIQSNRKELTKFCLPYETNEELRLRLLNTVILVNQKPYEIHGVDYIKKKSFMLYLTDVNRKGKELLVDFKEPNSIPDLRPPSPRYVEYNGLVWYLVRHPARKVRQGLYPENCFLRGLDRKEFDAQQTLVLNTQEIVSALSTQPREFNQKTLDLVRDHTQVFVSHKVALSRQKVKDKIMVHYNGRYFGNLDGNEVHPLDETERDIPWIRNDLNAASMVME